MLGIFLVTLFLVLMIIGVPIAFVIAIIAFAGITAAPHIPIVTVVMKMFNGLNSFVLLAVPLFILAANLMNSGKISKKLIDFSIAIVGPVKGGLAHANVLVSMIFAGISGASQADTAGIGKVLIPNMIDTGYDKETAVGVTAASSTIGVIIPPSIPMIIYAGLTSTSISSLFLAGMVPGILSGLGMMIVIAILARKRNYPLYEKSSLKKILKLGLEAFPALMTPIIIIGGVITGWYTATEAAAIASLYTFVIGMFYYKTIKFKDIPDILVDTLTLSSLSLFALSAASALGELLGYYQVSTIVEQFFTTYIDSASLFMVIVIAFFLFIGTFMDAIPAMILFVPVILPVSMKLGISPVLLGMVTIITLAIGLVTPPYGLCLMIAAKIGNMSIEKSFSAVIMFIGVVFAVLLFIAFLPEIAFYIPLKFDPYLLF
ncbi:tripartite ATP-independent transporter DctM subunit [Halanaerobium saccharolyticum]|uniref:Tripartite ATP-independent transporter DctM subunit n=1 Tax=Halanaerobium saccharolyticum TaxID=43595 RepID=A0A4V3CFU1_9FIRM|nr:TRAP transporter large permease [Halanaerobium saccharolyticum]TDO95182.1 tripartite ATP-independent transporter DctM subunit [Halanaerobium saccharolyticum]